MSILHNRINNEELKERMRNSHEQRTTLSFYAYFGIEDPQSFRDVLYQQWEQLGVFGRAYVAKEGINAQISMPTEHLENFRKQLYAMHPSLNGIRLNIAVEDDGKSFYKLKIKVRHKIVADGLNDTTFDASKRGRALSATEVNELMEQRDTIVVDMRNHYESEVGHFEGAICPEAATFREALPEVEHLLADKKDHTIIMYCTGGIRCEKASAYYLHKGFDKVCMIEGGIIDYTHQCENEGLDNKFIGKNFVFDERMGERISEDVISHCHQCGQPCDTHVNCANDACHLLFIQCEECAQKFDHCCSQKCADFSQLPQEEQIAQRKTAEFNGTKFGKGRYRSFREASLQ